MPSNRFSPVKSLLSASSVAGRAVTNIHKNYSTPTVPSGNLASKAGRDSDAEYYTGFRTIPLGDIDLQREIQLDSHSGVASLRRLHSARVEGKASDVTVAIYQGAGAKQVRRIIDSLFTFRLNRCG